MDMFMSQALGVYYKIQSKRDKTWKNLNELFLELGGFC